MKRILLAAMAIATLTACHHHDEPTEQDVNRAVLVYMAADNDLQGFLPNDLSQIMAGAESLRATDKLLLLIDEPQKAIRMYEVSNDKRHKNGTTDTVRLGKQFAADATSANPQVLHDALAYVVERYPQAKSYGLVLWGHATGWEIQDTVPTHGPRRAYGINSESQWMNIPQMAQALSGLPQLDFIFADCCTFQCIESAYELRHATSYIIASAAEIPGDGAPYQTVVPAMFSQDENYLEQMVDAYFAQTLLGYQEPLSIIKTSELDNLAQATRATMQSFATDIEVKVDDGTPLHYPDVSGLIYYYNRAFFDMQDFMLRHASSDQYEAWKRAFDEAVVYKTMVKKWMANHISSFSDFSVTTERYGGVSMFVPQNPNQSGNYRNFHIKLNQSINQMQWYHDVGLADFGW